MQFVLKWLWNANVQTIMPVFINLCWLLLLVFSATSSWFLPQYKIDNHINHHLMSKSFHTDLLLQTTFLIWEWDWWSLYFSVFYKGMRLPTPVCFYGFYIGTRLTNSVFFCVSFMGMRLTVKWQLKVSKITRHSPTVRLTWRKLIFVSSYLSVH